MIISRRGFLGAIIAAAAAPAIVRADSLMRVWTPPAPKLIVCGDQGLEDLTLQANVMPDGQWHHVSLVRSQGRVLHYLDGKLVSERQSFMQINHGKGFSFNDATLFPGQIDEVRLSAGART